MNARLLSREHTLTPFIKLDTRKCTACWQCLNNCPNQVISKIDLPWHKHALIVEPDSCTGCLKCIKTCQTAAYSKVNGAELETARRRIRALNSFLINNLLLLTGLAMIISGLVMQLGFHVGGPDGIHESSQRAQLQSLQYEQVRQIDTNKIVCGFNYSDWSATHKFAVVVFSLLMTYHIYGHWKWYKGVVTKHLVRKNRQVVTLSVIFVLVAITGLVPWANDLTGGTSILRLFFIEIHDKLALILVIYLALHVTNRTKWFSATYSKLRR